MGACVSQRARHGEGLDGSPWRMPQHPGLGGGVADDGGARGGSASRVPGDEPLFEDLEGGEGVAADGLGDPTPTQSSANEGANEREIAGARSFLSAE